MDKELISKNDSPIEGLIVRGRPTNRDFASISRPKSRSKSRCRNMTCNYCKKKGHCFKLKIKQNNKIDQNKPVEASMVEDVIVSNILFVTRAVPRSKQNWCLDIVTSFHMFVNREWFSTYEPIIDIVLMVNNESCEVRGIGTVKLKMHDGVIRTLTGIRHILNTRKNLISLSTLTMGGHTFIRDDHNIAYHIDGLV
ncbi:hypothetical protein MANES_11G033850v8 [Manihot esculenta]|uniref:Uncharacterized protein n=1 Tax=Manihot esculenta TaxID=3983 RepID=A0ACB7GSN0_MANES|nr:hypothetical protein MANES_11G033850v8 [Manihot esculenta]